jgi:hypothetical protein
MLRAIRPFFRSSIVEVERKTPTYNAARVVTVFAYVTCVAEPIIPAPAASFGLRLVLDLSYVEVNSANTTI